jgi:hypothetical protein
MKQGKVIRVVVEVRGGNVQNVYSDQMLDVQLVDWDNIEAGDAPIEQMRFQDGSSVSCVMADSNVVL